MADISAGNSEDALCIEDYLVKSEREWYSDFKMPSWDAQATAPALDPVPALDLDPETARAAGHLS